MIAGGRRGNGGYSAVFGKLQKIDGQPTMATGSKRKWYQLRIWHGMTMSVWFAMLRRNRFRVSPSRYYLVALISISSLLNSIMAVIQRLVFGRQIATTVLRKDPIFIIGHWRSGTTLLHQLLTLDDRHAFPTTYACFAPSHFLVSQKWLSPWLRWLIPRRRSQDNVQVGFDLAQEDEWALCNLGLPTPYRAAAFPNDLPQDPDYFSLNELSSQQRNHWIDRWTTFLRSVAMIARGRRLVLKSPLHTARIDTVLEVFPEARFVHVMRDPRDVYPSTIRLWKRLAEDEGLQVAKFQRLKDHVIGDYIRMYQSFDRCRHEIPRDRICELRYEDLIADPVAQLRKIYRRLNLQDFDRVVPRLRSVAEDMSGFATNQHRLSENDAQSIDRKWGIVADRFDRGAA